MLEKKSSIEMGATLKHSLLLMESYHRLTGKHLIELSSAEDPLMGLFESPKVILSHGTEADPILNYGNRAAMQLWEMDWQTFTRTRSRETAEPMVQEKREAFLQGVRQHGYVEGYSGVRISATGKRFEIVDVTVWNVIDAFGVDHGQAATFAKIRRIDPVGNTEPSMGHGMTNECEGDDE